MELIKRHLFWVVMAGVMVVVIVADVVLVGRMQVRIARERGELRSTLDEGEKLATGPVVTDPSNADFIVAAESLKEHEAYKKGMEGEVQKYVNFYRTLSYDLYKPLPGTEDHIRSNGLPRPAAFKTIYPAAMAELLKRLVGRGIQLGGGVLVGRDWGTTMPQDDEIFLSQVEYWLLNDIFDVISDPQLKVKRLEGLVVDVLALAGPAPGAGQPEPEMALPEQAMFSAVPVSIEVYLDSRTVPLFFQALERMKGRRAAQVTGFSVTRVTGSVEEKLFSPLVSLKAQCDILHYSGPAAEEETTTAAVGG